MQEQSELGTIVGAIHHGDIIIKETGEMVYYSCAYNPLNEKQLLEIAQKMRELK